MRQSLSRRTLMPVKDLLSAVFYPFLRSTGQTSRAKGVAERASPDNDNLKLQSALYILVQAENVCG